MSSVRGHNVITVWCLTVWYRGPYHINVISQWWYHSVIMSWPHMLTGIPILVIPSARLGSKEYKLSSHCLDSTRVRTHETRIPDLPNEETEVLLNWPFHPLKISLTSYLLSRQRVTVEPRGRLWHQCWRRNLMLSADSCVIMRLTYDLADFRIPFTKSQGYHL